MKYIALILTFLWLFDSKTYAYDLGPQMCGGLYGLININLSKAIKNDGDVRRKLSNIPWGVQKYKAPKYFVASGNKDEVTSLVDEVTAALHSLEDWRSNYGSNVRSTPGTDIFVPIGSEEFVAKSLIKAGVISKATRAIGGCGGTDLVALRLDDKDIFKDPAGLQNYLFNSLQKYVEFGRRKGLIQRGRTTVSPFPPHFPTVELKIIVPSEISRATKRDNLWDKFTMIFSVANYRAKGYDVVAYAMEMTHAPRSIWRDVAPSDDYFKLSTGSRIDEEFTAAASVVRFLAKSPEDCITDTLGPALDSVPQFECKGDPDSLAE